MDFKQLRYVFLGLASVFFVACTEEDDNVQVPEYAKFENPGWMPVAGPEPAIAPADWTVEFVGGMETPDWEVVTASPMQKPDWQAPDMFVYPSSMTAVIRMSDYIRPDITSDDCLAAFIGTECRGVAEQVENAQGEVYYLVQVKGNQDEVRNVEFRYYCHRKKEIFIAGESVAFESDVTLGSMDSPYMLTWNSQGELPYYMDLEVKVNMGTFDQGSVAEGDRVAAFAGDECRGLGYASGENGDYVFRFRTWARNETEKLTLKYYTSELKDMYVDVRTIDFRHTERVSVEMTLSEHGYMDLYISLPEVVRPYLSEKDNVAAFVGDHPCSIVQDKLNGTYQLKMKGSAGDKVSFRYYCDSLKHVFATGECTAYADASSWGSASAYQNLPLNTAFKLVTMRAVFTVEQYEAINTELAEGDLLAAFVGDECRGVAKAERYDGRLIFDMNVRGTLGVPEQFVLKYYHVANRYMFTCGKVFDFEAGGEIGSRNQPMGIAMQVVE